MFELVTPESPNLPAPHSCFVPLLSLNLVLVVPFSPSVWISGYVAHELAFCLCPKTMEGGALSSAPLLSSNDTVRLKMFLNLISVAFSCCLFNHSKKIISNGSSRVHYVMTFCYRIIPIYKALLQETVTSCLSETSTCVSEVRKTFIASNGISTMPAENRLSSLWSCLSLNKFSRRLSDWRKFFT